MSQSDMDQVMADGKVLFVTDGPLAEQWAFNKDSAQRMAPGTFVEAQGDRSV